MKPAEKIRFYVFHVLFYISMVWSVSLLPFYIQKRLYKNIILSLLIIVLCVYETAIKPYE